MEYSEGNISTLNRGSRTNVWKVGMLIQATARLKSHRETVVVISNP